MDSNLHFAKMWSNIFKTCPDDVILRCIGSIASNELKIEKMMEFVQIKKNA